jgi:glycine/D-amino acid oxidase-like deaminating enzyme
VAVDRDYIEAVDGLPGKAGSVWLDSTSTEYPPLAGERKTDVLVVGGGITGVLVARRLSAEGRRVIVLERRRIASGTTGHSTAKVTALHGASWRGLLGDHPQNQVRAWASANLAAVDELVAIALETGAGCGLSRVPAYLVAGDEETNAGFDEHVDALMSAGLPVAAADAPRPFGLRAARLESQALIDPAALVVAVVSALGAGADVYEGTSVRSLSRDGEGWRAHCDSGSVWAPVAVMADHFPVYDTGAFFGRLFPYAHYALEFVPREAVPEGMWMQVGGDALTLRATSGADGTWIAGGQRVRVASADDEREVYQSLADSLTSLVGEVEVVRHWSAHDHETPDGLPFIGEAPLGENLFMAAGFAGWGMTKSVVAASIIADAIAGRSHAVAGIVSPSRVPGADSIASLVEESATVARDFIEGHLTPRSEKAHDGSVAGRNCTHLGCETKWNWAEGTVDCPCHGSRYGRHGDVIYGPASKDIEAES